jgi:ferredoxin
MRPSFRIKWRLADGTELVTDGYEPLNILGHAEVHEISMRQACGGQAECGTCRFRVLDGDVTEAFGEERDLLERFAQHFEPGERLACRALPKSDLSLEIPKRAPRDLRTQSKK